ncbi:hypothetical protein ACGC1H_001075 [Rhizoctonia solani]
MSLESNQAGDKADGVINSTVFDPGYPYTPYERIAGKSAADILKQVDNVLQSTNIVLENHKDFLPSGQFAALKKAYRRYHWQMAKESQEDRAYYDKPIRESRILSQLYANRQTHEDRAKIVLCEVETFQTRVLSASRNAHTGGGIVLFEDELNNSPAPSRTSTLDSFTSWLSVFGRSSGVSSVDLEATKAQSDPAPAYESEGEGYIVSVIHFPESPNEPGSKEVVGSGSQIYRRMIAFKNNKKRVEIIGVLPSIT